MHQEEEKNSAYANWLLGREAGTTQDCSPDEQ